MKKIKIKIEGKDHLSFLIKYFHVLTEAIKELAIKSQTGSIENAEKIVHLQHATDIYNNLKIKQIQQKTKFHLNILPVDAYIILKYSEMINDNFAAFTPDNNIRIIEMNDSVYSQIINNTF